MIRMYCFRQIKKIKVNLAQGGVVICSIPNVKHYRTFFKLVFKKQWEYKDKGVLDKTHLRFFTEKSIKDMFQVEKFGITQKNFRCGRTMKLSIITFK